MLTQLVYSRQIIRTTGTGTYFSVTLKGVPLDALSSTGSLSFSGAAIQSYITSISYEDGPVTSGQIVASTTYVSTDWVNVQQPPTLTLTFGK